LSLMECRQAAASLQNGCCCRRRSWGQWWWAVVMLWRAACSRLRLHGAPIRQREWTGDAVCAGVPISRWGFATALSARLLGLVPLGPSNCCDRSPANSAGVNSAGFISCVGLFNATRLL
jgi:hypothetical protein